MLFLRALPRDQFDILALWKRWNQRRAYSTMMADPARAAAAQYGSVARVSARSAAERAKEEALLDEVSQIRASITEALEAGDGIPGFPDALLSQQLDNTWRDTAHAVVGNWVGLVYQLTHRDRCKPFMDGVDPGDPLGLNKR